jgi:hypothetical protein
MARTCRRRRLGFAVAIPGTGGTTLPITFMSTPARTRSRSSFTIALSETFSS